MTGQTGRLPRQNTWIEQDHSTKTGHLKSVNTEIQHALDEFRADPVDESSQSKQRSLGGCDRESRWKKESLFVFREAGSGSHRRKMQLIPAWGKQPKLSIYPKKNELEQDVRKLKELNNFTPEQGKLVIMKDCTKNKKYRWPKMNKIQLQRIKNIHGKIVFEESWKKNWFRTAFHQCQLIVHRQLPHSRAISNVLRSQQQFLLTSVHQRSSADIQQRHHVRRASCAGHSAEPGDRDRLQLLNGRKHIPDEHAIGLLELFHAEGAGLGSGLHHGGWSFVESPAGRSRWWRRLWRRRWHGSCTKPWPGVASTDSKILDH